MSLQLVQVLINFVSANTSHVIEVIFDSLVLSSSILFVVLIVTNVVASWKNPQFVYNVVYTLFRICAFAKVIYSKVKKKYFKLNKQNGVCTTFLSSEL